LWRGFWQARHRFPLGTRRASSRGPRAHGPNRVGNAREPGLASTTARLGGFIQG
jgi:hypothetical protein